MSSNVKSDGVVIIPTYNEKENIENIICKVLSLEHAFDILVIDDGSPDGTADIVKRLMTEFTGRLFIIERSGKQGLGTAYITGFKWALAHGYEYIFEMDADFSHNPDDLLEVMGCLRQQRCGCCYRVSLYNGGKCRKLADGSGDDVIFCIKICTVCHRNEYCRYDCRI